MKKKNNALVAILTIVFLGLAAVIFLTVQKLQAPTPVAPTVPQVTPKATSAACTLTFVIAQPTPTPTATPSATPTPTTAPTCNSSCTTNADCQSSNVCIDSGTGGKVCRNAQCTSAVNCACPTPTPTPTPTPGPTATPAPTPISCNGTCTTNADCSGGMSCIDTGAGKACRNPSCSTATNCACPTPTPGPTPTPVTPQVPVSGNGPSILGASVIAGGFFLLLLGLVF